MALKWGVIGAGSVARRRTMPAINQVEGMEIAALMVRDLKRAEALAKEYGADRYYDRVEALLDDEAVDAIYVATPVYLHCPLVIQAAERGKHILCEKPMALDVAECQRMIVACSANDVHLEICFVMRYWPIYRRIKGLIESGGLGEIVEIKGHLVKWMSRAEGAWRTDPQRSGGGALIDVGAHYLDLFRYLIGDFDQIVYMGSRRVFGWKVEESAFVLVRFRGGIHGTLGISFTVPRPGNLVEIYGTKGTLLLGDQLRVTTERGTTEEKAEFPDYYSPLMAHFRRCVEEEEEPLASGLDGLKNMEAIEGAYRSAEEGKIIQITPSDY